MSEPREKTNDDWKSELTPELYHIAREKGTERAFTGGLYNEKRPGQYHCACCHSLLFSSDAKYDSGSGWPSFFEPESLDSVRTEEDFSHGMHRVEVLCAQCDAHLGHVFPDGPKPTGQRYCINSLSLDFKALP